MSTTQPAVVLPGRANPLRAVVLLGCLPIVAFLAFGLTLALDYPTDRNGMIGLALLTTVVALVPVILDQGRPAERRHMLLSFYCLLFIAHFCLPIFTQYTIVLMPSDPPGVYGGSLFPADIMVGQGVALIGLLSLLIGYLLVGAFSLTNQPLFTLRYSQILYTVNNLYRISSKIKRVCSIDLLAISNFRTHFNG